MLSMCIRGFVLGVVNMLLISHVFAGPWYDLGYKLDTADAIVEVTVSHDRKTDKVHEILLVQSDLPFTDKVADASIFSTHSKCWSKITAEQDIKVLLFYKRRHAKQYTQHYGVENGQGFYTSLNPNYDALVQSIKAFVQNKTELPANITEGQSDAFCR
ncbi:MAG: hypothetical protein HOM11_00330 [Methylococcales bacterium]|jgi:hypothetical protein|nr:hypothetical protein [Methylococcales bacterium]MBT7442656.1 hypothetical protein [Methylococcales bacterium]